MALLKVVSAAILLALVMRAPRVIAEDQGPPRPPGEYAEPYGDPMVSFNEKMFWFNLKLDHYVLHPVAKGYAMVAPRPVRESVGRFFDNVEFIPRFANNLFQLRFAQAAGELGRFGINSTFGRGRTFRRCGRLVRSQGEP